MSRVLTAADRTQDTVWDCDVCIIGSGAGGAVLAAGLAEQGASVVVLEAGPHRSRADFKMREATAMMDLYQEAGTRSTEDLAITILQGRSVGGGTTVNWTSCFRTPDRILQHWREVHGLSELTPDALRPHFEAVESRLNIREWPKELANANNRVLLDGCAKLGWDSGPMRRNVKGCANSGYCGMGCPVDAKQAMHLTYLQDALAAGARVQAEAAVHQLDVEGDRIVAVRARIQPHGHPVPSGPLLTVRAKVTAVCGGAINSPALLLRSQIAASSPVGKRTFLHPVVAVLGQYEQPIHPWYGAPQSSHSHRFIDRGPHKMGFFLEAAPLHPALAAAALKVGGAEHAGLMAQLHRTSALLALHVDGLLPGDEGGVVTIDDSGRPRVAYPIGPQLLEALPVAHDAMARIHLAAGAQSVLTSHTPVVSLSDEAGLGALKDAEYGALKHGIFTAHQMGGCTMGTDPSTSVVNPKHRVHGLGNLFIVDGSVLPTALGVNPSQTIYGLAHRARRFVAEAI
ncbi:MAG: GMC family oxidoreductase N-terminal domain-containing protein [Myxococcota bacterium]